MSSEGAAKVESGTGQVGAAPFYLSIKLSHVGRGRLRRLADHFGGMSERSVIELALERAVVTYLGEDVAHDT